MHRFIIISLLLIFQCQKSEIQSADFLQGVNNTDFLTGNFSEKSLPVYTNPKEKTTAPLRQETITALQKLINDFEKETNMPVKQHIFITSGFRSFSSQKGIWEGKFTGQRKMRLPVKGKSEKEIIDLILEYSSAPGTSRHHWGTDFDINVLTNDYYQKGGRGEFIYQWMKKNAARYGFCQPYNELAKRNNKGYNEEKWHWSYKPLSSIYTREWIKLYKEGKISFKGKFAGSDSLGSRPLDYVSSINKDCL